VAGYYVRIDNGDWLWIGDVTSWTAPDAIADGDHTFSVKAEDEVGNQGDAASVAFTIDATPPSTPQNIRKTTADNDNTPSFAWDAASDDLSGMAGYYVRIDDGDWLSIGDVTSWTALDAIADGDHTFSVKAIDNVGSESEAGSVAFSIDATPPSMPQNIRKTTPDNDNTPAFAWDASDDLSGVAGYYVRIDNGDWLSIGDVTSWTALDAIADGDHIFSVKAIDNVGSESEAGSVAFTIDATAPLTSPERGLWKRVLPPVLASMGAVCLVLAFWLRKRG
jgi:predicted phage tail protein